MQGASGLKGDKVRWGQPDSVRDVGPLLLWGVPAAATLWVMLKLVWVVAHRSLFCAGHLGMRGLRGIPSHGQGHGGSSGQQGQGQALAFPRQGAPGAGLPGARGERGDPGPRVGTAMVPLHPHRSPPGVGNPTAAAPREWCWGCPHPSPPARVPFFPQGEDGRPGPEGDRGPVVNISPPWLHPWLHPCLITPLLSSAGLAREPGRARGQGRDPEGWRAKGVSSAYSRMGGP